MIPIELLSLSTSIYELRHNIDLVGHHVTIEDDEERLYATVTTAGLSFVADADGTIRT
jgi:hypothetical protein